MTGRQAENELSAYISVYPIPLHDLLYCGQNRPKARLFLCKWSACPHHCGVRTTDRTQPTSFGYTLCLPSKRNNVSGHKCLPLSTIWATSSPCFWSLVVGILFRSLLSDAKMLSTVNLAGVWLGLADTIVFRSPPVEENLVKEEWSTLLLKSPDSKE